MVEIQERELVEADLRKSKDSLAKAQQIAKLGNWDLDLINNSLYWSDEVYLVFDREPQKFKPSYEIFLDTVYLDDREFVIRSVNEALYENKIYSIDYRIVLPDGSIRFVHEQGEVFFDSNGKPNKMLGTVQDITERKQAEDEKEKLEWQLQQSHKMQAVGTLAGGIAHEFNNLLGIIIGFIEMTIDVLPADRLSRSNLNHALEASFRVRDLVKQILTFSRKQMDQKRVSLNLASSIKETLKLIKPSIPSSVVLNLNISEDYNHILADSSEISQIMMNFCSNAVWAMKDKGILEISLKQIDLSDKEAAKDLQLKEGEYLTLSFSDTGVGMSTNIKERVFEPFFTTKDIGQGTGMGLATVLGIMESYGGTISVESELENGTAFHLYFPTIKDVTSEKENASEYNIDEEELVLTTGKNRILFVDDEEMYTKMGKELLTHLGYAVTAETSSKKALKLFQADPEKFDLVITDQIMPNISGDELTKELLAIRPNIPIILCTGYSSQLDEAQAKTIGIREYVMKPFIKKDIAKLIREILNVP